MSDWVMPAPLAKPPPREVRMSGVSKGLSIVFGLVLGLPLVIVLTTWAATAHREAILAQRGVMITGAVTKLHIVDGKGRSYRTTYSYTPPELSQNHSRSVSTEINVSVRDYYHLWVGEPIEVVYDPRKPDRSLLKSDLDSHRSATLLRLPVVIWVMIVGLPIGPFALFYFIYRREKHLLQWGKAAPATIIGKVEYSTKAGRQVRVTYTFVDDDGVTVQGKRGGIPARGARVLHNPTAVFDPSNSERNTLYPGSVARLQ